MGSGIEIGRQQIGGGIGVGLKRCRVKCKPCGDGWKYKYGMGRCMENDKWYPYMSTTEDQQKNPTLASHIYAAMVSWSAMAYESLEAK